MMNIKLTSSFYDYSLDNNRNNYIT